MAAGERTCQSARRALGAFGLSRPVPTRPTDDDMQHAVVTTAAGTLTEVYWKPGQGVHEDVLTNLGTGIVGIAAYCALDDDRQHVIICTRDGAVREVFWRPAQGVLEAVVTRFGTPSSTSRRTTQQTMTFSTPWSRPATDR